MIHELGDNLIPIMAIGCTFLAFTCWIVMATIDSIYKTRCSSKLKERLPVILLKSLEVSQLFIEMKT
jgi:hypothetical protein